MFGNRQRFFEISDEGTSTSSSPCRQLGVPNCYVFRQFAQTSIETRPTSYLGSSLRTSADGGYTCDYVNGWFTRPAVEADQLDIDDLFFKGTTISDDSQLAGVTNAVDLVRQRTWEYGICSDGFGIEGSEQVELKTRDGQYDPGESRCKE